MSDNIDDLLKQLGFTEEDTVVLEQAKTVEEWVNTVSYAEDLDYMPSDFALEFVTFIKMVNGEEGEENVTPVLHLKIFDQVAGGEDRIANMIHRGAAKTTIMEYLFLYLGVYGGVLPKFGKIEVAIYLSDSIDNGVKSMRKNLEFRWENSTFLQTFLPPEMGTKFTDVRWEFVNLDGDVFIVKGYGAKTGVRGVKEQGVRPRLAVLDDLVSDEDARSPVVIASIENTVNRAINFALHPEKNIVIWSGTPFNAGDPLYKAVESGAWKVNVFPVCEKFPCTKEEFRGSWEDRFPYEYVKREYVRALKQGKVKDFNQELMLRIMSDEDRLIQDSDIKFYRRKDLLKRRNNFNFYITTDFATTEKESGDFSFISVWAYNANGDWFWVDGCCERQTMDKNINDLFHFVTEYRPESVGIEVSGQQGGFIPWIQQKMLDTNIWFNLASKDNSSKPGIRPNTNKMERFNVVTPWFKAGKMYFPEEMKHTKALQELLLELSLASVSGFKSKQDDAIDTVSMLGLMKAWKPSMGSILGKDKYGIYSSIDSEDNYVNTYIV